MKDRILLEDVKKVPMVKAFIDRQSTSAPGVYRVSFAMPACSQHRRQHSGKAGLSPGWRVGRHRGLPRPGYVITVTITASPGAPGHADPAGTGDALGGDRPGHRRHGNHEEEYGQPVNNIAAALILADKSDTPDPCAIQMANFDIHDRSITPPSILPAGGAGQADHWN